MVAASDVDVHVGARMRQRRESLGISEGRLGRHLGLTAFQIEKYERGSNRIGAGRLYQIAEFLGVSPNWFFEGIGPPAAVAPPADTAGHPEGTRLLVEAFEAIDDPETRASVLALVRSLVSSSAESGHPAVRAAAQNLT